jgi:prepilin-type N-terminal cleavage/methylation domain-containing protein
VNLRSDESGFTLVEMLVAITIGMVVMLAAFEMLDRSVQLTGKTTNRVDSTQRGRLAMDTITRHLTSEVCPTASAVSGGTPLPIESGDQYSVTFWAFFGTRVFTPRRYTIAWNANSQSITETIDSGANTAVIRNATLLTNARLPNNTPLFSYYGYPAGGSWPTTALGGATGTLSDTDRGQVSRIDVAFTAAPTTAKSTATPPESTPYSGRVYVRTSEPDNLAGPKGPQC